MKRALPALILIPALGLGGCVSKTLTKTMLQTREFAHHVTSSYRSDLQTLSAAEARRKADFQQVEQRLIAMQQRLVTAEELAHRHNQRAAKRELESSFDREARIVLSQGFWLKLGELRTATGATDEIDTRFEALLTALGGVAEHPKDDAARARSILEIRRFLAANTRDVRFAEEQSRRLASKLGERRDAFLRAGFARIDAVKLPPQKRLQPSRATVASFEQEIDRRASDVDRAGHVLDISFITMSNSLNASKDVAAIAEGFFAELTRTHHVQDFLGTMLDHSKIGSLTKDAGTQTTGSEGESPESLAALEGELQKVVEDEKSSIGGLVEAALADFLGTQTKTRMEASQ